MSLSFLLSCLTGCLLFSVKCKHTENNGKYLMKTRICNELLLKGDYSGHDILEMSNKTETYPRDSKVKLFPVGHT